VLEDHLAGTIELLAVLITTIVGSGAGTSIVGLLFKHRFDVQLAKQTAMLQRHSRIHELQVEALGVIHSDLNDALFYLQRIASAGRTRGQVDDAELFKRMGERLAKAASEFSKTQLLFSQELTTRLNEFFKKVFETGAELELSEEFSQFPMGEGVQLRADLIDKVRNAAFKEIPTVLDEIRREARTVIHG